MPRSRCRCWVRPTMPTASRPIQNSRLRSATRSNASSAESRRSVQLRFHPAPDARSRHHLIVPALDVGKIGQLHLVAGMAPCPTEDRKIGYRQRVRHELAGGKPPVEHPIKAPRLGHEALEPIGAVLLVLQ